MRKAADYQGYSNWETWNTSLMLDNDYDTYKKSRELFEKGMTVEQLQDYLLRKVIGPYNKERIEEAKEWNSIPKDERIDYHYEDLKNKSPEAADFVDALGFGKDVEDSEPELIDPDLVNYQEIWDHLYDEIEGNNEYDRQMKDLQSQGLSWTTNHDLMTNQMRDAFYRYHGAIPEEELEAMPGSQWDNPGAYHNINVTTPWEQLEPAVMEGSLLGKVDRETRMKIWERQNELYPNMSHYEREHVIDWEKDPVVQQLIESDPNIQKLKQEGYTQRLHDLTWQTINAIHRSQPTPYADVMRQALEQRGYTPEQIQEMFKPQWRWQPNPQYRDPNAPYDQRTNPGDWINLSPKMDQAQIDKSLDQPGDMTLPEHWGNVSDPWDAMFADQGNDWSDPDATQHRRPFIIDFEDIDNPDPPIWIGEPGQYHDESPLYNVERPYYGEIWEHTDPPVIQRSWGTDDVYDPIAKAQAERHYYQQQGMKKRAVEQSSDGRLVLYRGIALSRNDGAMLARDPQALEHILLTEGNMHWTDSSRIAHEIAGRNGLPGLVIEGFVNPADVVQQGTDEWENLVHNNGVFIPGTTLYDQEREVPVRQGAQIEVASIVFVNGDEQQEIDGPRVITASDGADYWTQSQDDWWGTQNDSLFNVNTPGEAPGMPHNMDTGADPSLFKNPCWCDVGPTDPHEWTGACENGKRPTMEHEAADHWRDEPRDETGKWTRHPDSLKPVKGKHHRLKVHDHKNHEHHIVRCWECGLPMDVYKGEVNRCHHCGARRPFEDDLLDSLKDSRTAAFNHDRFLRENGFEQFGTHEHAKAYRWTDPQGIEHRLGVSRNPNNQKYVAQDVADCQAGKCRCADALWQPAQAETVAEPDAPIHSNSLVGWGGETWTVGEIANDIAEIFNTQTGESEIVPVRDLALAKTAGRSVILYHGTTNKGWQVAQENGGIGARDYEQAAAEVAEHYGLDPKEVYEHDWNQFTRTRTANDVWLTGSRQAAEHYAQDRNEVTTDLLRTVFRMTQMTEESPYPSYRDPAFAQFRTDYFESTNLRPLVLTLEVPLDALPMTAQRQLDAGYTDLQDTTLKGPVPLEWVTNVEELPDNPEAPFQPWYSHTAAMTPNQLQRLIDENDLPEDQSETVHQFPDGYTIRNLKTFGDERREGTIMNHCWATGTCPSDDATPHPNPYYYSLRDPNNVPKASFYYVPPEGGYFTEWDKPMDATPYSGGRGPWQMSPQEMEKFWDDLSANFDTSPAPTDPHHVIHDVFGHGDSALHPKYYQYLEEWLRSMGGPAYESTTDHEGSDRPYYFRKIADMVPSGQVHVMPEEGRDEWGEGQWDTDTFLDHRMLNKSLREQQQAQEYLDFMKRHKRAEDAEWPSIGMKEAADSPSYSDDPEAWMADREAWYAQEPRDCPRCGRGPTVYGSDLHGEKQEWCPSCGWTDRDEVKQQAVPKPGDYAKSRDGHPVQIIRLYTEGENLFALIRYLDGYQPYSVGGRAGGTEEDPLWEHRVYDGKVVRPGGDYYNDRDWRIERGLQLQPQDALPGITGKTAADNVPGMPVSDSGHWVWLDGKVGFGGAHHEIAEKLADELGYGKDDKAYVANWLARGHCPQDRAVAVGTFKNNRPYIWNSTRDRNHIWDAVMQAREGLQTAS